MMNGWRIALVVLALSGIVPCAVVMCSAHEVSVACMMAYDEGGARAVVSTYECPRWELGLNRSPCEDTKSNCNFATATIQGHRDYQEDRVVCNHAMKIPVLGKDELKELTIGIAAVFDGHAGAEASELASRKFLDYFYINVVFKNYKQAISNHKVNYEVTNLKSSRGSSSLMEGDASLKSILNEALIKTFEDIDSEFTEDALKYGYKSGSTGTVALLANGQVLVGYVGDSKALLCSVSTRAAEHAKGTSSGAGFAEELTIDHHPDREDEKARIEASGGFVRTWGVPRVNGMLAMTRAFGDLSFKRFGVIAEPEVIGWRSLTGENTFLVLGTDGIFEGLTPSHVCAVLNDNACTGKNRSTVNLSSCLGLPALANLIVNLAFENGSNDNISVVLVPLESDDSS